MIGRVRDSLYRAIRIAFVSIGLTLGITSSSSSDLGKWTAHQRWGLDNNTYAVHLMLMRGDGNPDHSRILYWRTHQPGDPTFRGEEIGWSPGNDGCALSTNTGFEVRGAYGDPDATYDVFCSGHTPLPDGRMLVTNGTLPGGGAYGERKTAIFTPGAGQLGGSWSETGQQAYGRWYPSSISLRDLRTINLAGERYHHAWFFGGKRNGSLPTDAEKDSVLRFGVDPGGYWDASVRPVADGGVERPAARHRHSVANMEGAANFEYGQVFYGGLGTSDLPLEDGWLLRRDGGPVQAGDDKYYWKKILPANPPLRRSDCVTVARANDMVMFGGRNQFGSAFSDVWRLLRSGNPLAFSWDQMSITGTVPAMLGHSAVFDTMTVIIGGVPTYRERMLVFGGTSEVEQDPINNKIYELRFDLGNPLNATWHEHTPVDLGDGQPSARYWHSMNFDRRRVAVLDSDPGHVALIFGGKLAGGSYSNELWELRLRRDGTMAWKKRTYGGAAPPARALHSAVYEGVENPGRDPGFERLYINGGELEGGGNDAKTYMLEPRAANPTWVEWASSEAAYAGHRGAFDHVKSHVRTAETYDPTSGTWFTDTGAGLQQFTYPPAFVVPERDVEGGRVYSFGRDNSTYYLDVRAQGTPASGWQKLNIPAMGFYPTAGVMYQKGRIMAAGGVLTVPPYSYASGATKTLNTSSLSNQWQAAQDMVPRRYHNLVVLPGGKILVVGGLKSVEQAAADSAIYWPQLFDPASGTWTDTTNTSTRLARQQVVRSYHSTAILLPDGRVLSAGGENAYKHYAEIFCPPYLFLSDGTTPATRPVINSAPVTIRHGEGFSVFVSDAANVQKVCLMRPAATTHSFDQNQRHLELDFTPCSSPSRLLVSGPESPAVAPPGDYLLFVVGSLASTEVPSIAKWVRVEAPATADYDDLIPPATITDLTPEIVSLNSVTLTWTEPADDGSSSGTIQAFDMRQSTSPIPSECAYDQALPVAGEPAPGGLSSTHELQVTGLQCCTRYHFAMRARDDKPQFGGLHDSVRVRTLCPLGCGGSSARESRHEAASAGHASSEFVAGASNSVLIVETRRGAAGDWIVTARSNLDQESFGGEMGVLVQVPDGEGGWRTIARHRAYSAQDPIGLCSLREGGRLVAIGQYQIEGLAKFVRRGGAALELVSASHSRSGAFHPDIAGSDIPPLDAGDELSFTYRQCSGAAEDPSPWFAMLRWAGAAPVPTGQVTQRIDGSRPTSFALHQNVPNPFRGSTVIRFDLPAAAPVSLVVYDLLGRRIRTLAYGSFGPGFHRVEWDHRDDEGNVAQPGVYLYRLVAATYQTEHKMILTR